jgi:TetR/AcrR family transcriptional regulator
MQGTFMTKPTKQRILDAAENLFAQRGFEATAVVDITDQVGIRGPAFYKHFANKTDLYEAVLQRLFEPLKEAINAHGANSVDDPAEFTPLETLVSHHIAHPNISRIVQQATLAGDEQLDLLTREWYIPFFDLINSDSPGGPTVVMAFHSMLLGYITLAPLHKKIFNLEPLSKDNMSEQLSLQMHLVASLAENNWQW